MSVVYDAGALIAADRSDRAMWAYHRALLTAGVLPITTAAVVGQASRSSRQVQLRRLLKSCEIVDLAAADAHAVGELLGAADTSDVIDAHLVHVAANRNALVVTSDPSDIAHLSSHLEHPVPHREV